MCPRSVPLSQQGVELRMVPHSPSPKGQTSDHEEGQVLCGQLDLLCPSHGSGCHSGVVRPEQNITLPLEATLMGAGVHGAGVQPAGYSPSLWGFLVRSTVLGLCPRCSLLIC